MLKILKKIKINLQALAAPLTGGTHNRADDFSPTLLKLLRKNLVTKDNMVYMSDYDKDPVRGSVQIPVRNGEVTVGNYSTQNGATMTRSATSYLEVLITDDKAIYELIDGYEAQAVPDNLKAQRLDSAAYSMGLEMDSDGLTTLVSGGTTLSNTTASTVSTAYANVLSTTLALDKADVPRDMRFLIVSPDFYNLIKQDSNFATSGADSVFMEIKKMGAVGMVDGMPVFMSNNLASNVEFIAGSPYFAQRVMAFKVEPFIEDLKNEYIGSSAIKGRYLRKHIVTRAIAVQIKTKA